MQPNRASLSHALLLLSHCAPSNILSHGIRAIVTLLEYKEASRSKEVVAIVVARRVDPLVDMMEHVVEVVQELVTYTRRV